MGLILLGILLIVELLELFGTAASGPLKIGLLCRDGAGSRSAALLDSFGWAGRNSRAHVDGHNNLALGVVAGCVNILKQAHHSIIR